MKRVLLFAFLCVCLTSLAFGQSSDARVSGTVTDASGAVLPGVEIKATNTATGVENTALTNSTGAYNFASLLPGTYTISASLPSFQTQTFKDVPLGNAAQVRLNFALQVGGVATNVEVSITASQVLLETSSSVGNVLEQKKVQDLPLVSNNVMDLVGVMAGVNVTKDSVFGANDTKFAGVAAGNINVQRDGIPMSGGRWPTGLQPATTVNPDLVGEVRMILAPVDAELGRGSGQFQIQTRSGTNQFHGAAVWDAQNSVLDAHSWADNQTGATPLWRNQPEMTVSLGGPIKKNKTFFFGLFDKQWALIKEPVTAQVLTPCAQRGIYRYISGVAPTFGAAGGIPTWAQPAAQFPFPTAPWVNATGTATGPISYASVFGQDLSFTGGTPNADCSNALVSGPSRDPYRTQIDPSGYVNTLFKYMPSVNNFDIGDGLNVVGHRWIRRRDGGENLFDAGEPQDRKQWNAKIDHIFNPKHKISGAWSIEKDYASDAFMNWPNTWEGKDYNQPQVLTANFVSTLSPRLVNEARFGMSRTGTNEYAPLFNPAYHDAIYKLFPKSASGLEFPAFLGAGQANFQTDQPIGTRGFTPLQLLDDSTPRKTWADTLSLTVGKHSFRMGGEYRHGSSKNTVSSSGSATSPCASNFTALLFGFMGGTTNPIAYGGTTPGSPVQGVFLSVPGLQGFPGFPSFLTGGGSVQGMENLMTFLSGSLCGVAQYRFINKPTQAGVAWNDPTTDPFKIRDFHQNEIGTFFKDDWKVSSKVTFNLGVRWDYYGVPYEKSGLAATLVGNGAGLFGISGTNFGGWMSGGGTRGSLSQLTFVGPNSPNPDVKPYPRDLNNFGPAVGFAWNPHENMVVRGGYQIQYVPTGGGTGGGPFAGIESVLGQPPGSEFTATYQGDSAHPYLDLTSITKNQIPYPIAPPVLPVQAIPITNRTGTIAAYDVNYVNPYIQNLTLSITQDVNKHLQVDTRYIGTLTRKNYNTVNLNAPNFLTNGLKEAFDLARAGKDSPLLNKMFNGINIAGFGCDGNPSDPCGAVGTTVNGQLQTGALHLRTASNTRNDLANGNYATLATTLASLNYNGTYPGNESLPFVPFNVNGSVLRQNGFDENFILTNPQFGTVNLNTNGAHSNYHSLQALANFKNIGGFNFQTSYTWSKDLGVGTADFTDPRNQSADYTLLQTDRRHVVRTYGSFDLPIGPGKSFAGNSHGVLARIIEGWQTSWIVNLQSGAPESIVANNMLYSRGTPNQVRPFDFSGARGVQWAQGANAGFYFGDIFQKVADPQCLTVDLSIRSLCSLQALADKQGNIILQNPLPGTRGNVGLMSIEGAGVWNADMALTKTFKLRESLKGTVRMDARNIFNHPTPGASATPAFGAPAIDGGALLNLNDANPFGSMPAKGQSAGYWAPSQRSFQLKVRVDF